MYGSKRLIGTPQDGRGNNTRRDMNRDLDFTPVGEELYDRSIRQENNFSPLQNKRLIHKSPIASRLMHESSFDNTSHSFDTIASQSHQHWQPDMNFLDEINKNKESDYLHQNDNHQFLSNGSNPLKQQHDTVSRLQEENINLRVRLATLTRYFGEEPQDKKQLINHNIELKQSLIEMNNKLEQLNAYIRELEHSNNKENVLHESSFESHKNSQDEKLMKKENEMIKEQLLKIQTENEQFKQKLESLLYENDHLSKQNDRLEDLMNENHQLTRQVEKLEALVDELQHDDNNDDLERLQQKYESQLEDLKGEISDMQMELRSKEDMIDGLEHDLNQLKLDNQDLEDTVEALELKLKMGSPTLKQDEKLQRKLHDAMDNIHSLQNQIKTLQDNELRLINENEDLENVVSKLRHELQNDEEKLQKLRSRLKDIQQEQLRAANDDEYIQSIERERQDLYDQLISGEDKLSKLDRDLNSAKLEIKSLKQNRNDNDGNFIRLKGLNDSLHKEIETLQRELRNQDEMTREIEKLSRRLNSSTNLKEMRSSPIVQKNNNPFLEQELKRLTQKNDELQHVIDSMTFTDDSKLNSIIKKNESLKKEIEEKDNEIDKLSNKLRELSRSIKLESLTEDDEKLELMKEISKLKLKLNLVNIEKDNLKEEYTMKLSIIKRQLTNESHSSINETIELKLQESIRSKEDILIKLSNKQQELDQLSFKIEKLRKDNKELERIMFALEENEAKLNKENKSYLKEVNKLKQTCSKLINRLKQSPKGSSSSDLQLQLDNANQEIDILTSKYFKLRNELTTKIKTLESSKNRLKEKLIEISEQKRKVQYLPPTPLSSPINSPPPAAAVSTLNKIELKYLKLKNFQNQQTIKDLQIYNNILNKSINKNDQIMKQQVIKIDENINSNITDQYFYNHNPNPRRRLTFKILAKFVLASIRIRKRFEDLDLNRIYLNGLSKEIKREKLNLI